MTSKQQTISELTSLPEVRLIYKLQIDHVNYSRSLLIIILERNYSSVSKELYSMVGNIFQDQAHYLYRIFPFEYAHQQLMELNLFFVQGCLWSNLVYSSSKNDIDLFYQYNVEATLLNKIHFDLSKELNSIRSFMEGANYFLEKGDLLQSVLMFHQFMELLFRNVELFMMGEACICHSIREHQAFIKTFVPQLGNIFNIELDREQNMLKLLDEVCRITGNGNNHQINKQQILNIQEKADRLYYMVGPLFEDKINACRKEQDNQNTFKISDSEEAMDSEKSIPNSNEKELLGKIKDFAKEHYDLLKPYDNRIGLYKVEILTEGYLDTSFMISNLLKVCILAMNADEANERLIPEPSHNIQQVLKYALELMPYEEMELLDKLKALLQLESFDETGRLKTI